MDNIDQKHVRRARGAAILGRFFVLLAFFALIGAWITQLTGSTILGMNQQHLFYDSIVLSLLAVCMFLDVQVHFKNL